MHSRITALRTLHWRAFRQLLIGASLVPALVTAFAGPTNAPPKFQSRPRGSVAEREFFEDVVKRTAAENDAEYTKILGELGLKPEDGEHFKLQLAELHRKAIAAGGAMTELLEARVAYDKEIRAALGNENYGRYRYYEESKTARREYELLREFASKSNNLTLDPAWSEKIVRLIKDSKVTTTEDWRGPYDPRPQPEAGLAMVTVGLSRRAAEYRQASSNLFQTLPKSDLPVEYQRLLKDYCSQHITEMDNQLAKYTVPEEEYYRRILEEVRKRHRELMMHQRLNSTNHTF